MDSLLGEKTRNHEIVFRLANTVAAMDIAKKAQIEALGRVQHLGSLNKLGRSAMVRKARPGHSDRRSADRAAVPVG